MGKARALRETVLAGVVAYSALRPGGPEAGSSALAEAATGLLDVLTAWGGDGQASSGARVLLTEWLARLAVC